MLYLYCLLKSYIDTRIVNHLSKFSLIKESQHGFTKYRSCLTNLLEFLKEVISTLDQEKPVDIIYLDLQRHFIKFHIKSFKKN